MSQLQLSALSLRASRPPRNAHNGSIRRARGRRQRLGRGVRVNWRAARRGGSPVTTARVKEPFRCQSTPKRSARHTSPRSMRWAGRRSRSTRARWARPTPSISMCRPPATAGYADVVAPPMFAVVYSAPSVGPPIFDPEIELNFAMMVHGGQEFEWGPPVVAGDEITTTASVKDISEARRPRLLRVRVDLDQPARRAGVSRHMDQHRARSVRQWPDPASRAARSPR